jgi:uroporphyrinogen-III synthase
MRNNGAVMKDFAGLRVLSLESRRAEEMAKLIGTYSGQPISAPAMREVPLESGAEAKEFTAKLLRGEFDVVILLTGVGTRALTAIAETACSREQFVIALRKAKILARGPKPVAALRELGLTPTLTAPEPNTWREVLQTLDQAASATPEMRLSGLRIAVQEYGVSNPELLSGLRQRGACVTRVPVYQWALPEDTAPLRAAVESLANASVDVVLFTTGVQLEHLFQIAGEMGAEEKLRGGLRKAVVASIGPTTSEALRSYGIAPDLEPSHPKMGFLVKEAAEASGELLRRKRAGKYDSATL